MRTSEPVIAAGHLRPDGCSMDSVNDIDQTEYTVEDLLRLPTCPPIPVDTSIMSSLQVSHHSKGPSLNARTSQINGGTSVEPVSVGDGVILKIGVNASIPEDITVQVPAEEICDLAGNTNPQNASFTIYYRPTIGQPTARMGQRLVQRPTRFGVVLSQRHTIENGVV